MPIDPLLCCFPAAQRTWTSMRLRHLHVAAIIRAPLLYGQLLLCHGHSLDKALLVSTQEFPGLAVADRHAQHV